MVLTPRFLTLGNIFVEGLTEIRIVDDIKDESDALTVSCEFSSASLGQIIIAMPIGGYNETWKWPMGLYTFQSLESTPQGERVMFTSAAFSPSMKKKRNKSYQKLTLKDLVGKIAGRNGLRPKCDMKIKLDHVDQRGESDMALLQRFADKYNAIFNVKMGTLIFLSKSSMALPFFVIFKSEAISWNLRQSNKFLYKMVKAKYHDTKKNKSVEVKVGGGSPEHLIQGNYKNKGEAKALAKAKFEKLLAQTKTGTITVEGRNMVAGGKVLVLGFGKGDGLYLITRAEHRGKDTYTTTVTLERAV